MTTASSIPAKRADLAVIGGGPAGMMAAIAAARCEKPVTITGAECVAKSYPNFWEEYERLGGKLRRRYDLSLASISPDNWRQAALLTNGP